MSKPVFGQIKEGLEEALAHVAPDRIAPAGKIWMCGACGKTAKDRYGMVGQHSYGWDESCMLNAELVDDPEIAEPPNEDHR